MSKANPYKIKCPRCHSRCVRVAGMICSDCKIKDGAYRRKAARRKVYSRDGWVA